MFNRFQTDPLEEELIRHHHAVTEDKTSPNTNNADNYTPPDRSFESMSRDPNIQPIDENELYDITVGDVIRDVLLTLRDNPDIVKELIASMLLTSFSYLICMKRKFAD